MNGCLIAWALMQGDVALLDVDPDSGEVRAWCARLYPSLDEAACRALRFHPVEPRGDTWVLRPTTPELPPTVITWTSSTRAVMRAGAMAPVEVTLAWPHQSEATVWPVSAEFSRDGWTLGPDLVRDSAGVLVGRWVPGLIDCLEDQPAWAYTPVLQSDLRRGVPVLPREPVRQEGALVLARSVDVCPWAPHAWGAMVDYRRYRDEARRRSGLPPLVPGADKAP